MIYGQRISEKAFLSVFYQYLYFLIFIIDFDRWKSVGLTNIPYVVIS